MENDVKNLWYHLNKKRIDRLLYELEVQRMRGTTLGDNIKIVDIKQMFIGLINENIGLAKKLDLVEKEVLILKEEFNKLKREDEII